MREHREDLRADDGRPTWLGLSSVTNALIVANVAVFFLLLFTMFIVRPRILGITDPSPLEFAKQVRELLGLVPTAALAHGRVWQLLSYAFVHHTDGPGPLHLVICMLSLFFFGREIETLYGPRRFLALYLAGAVFAGLVYCALDYGATPIVGASGAVYAVMVAYACHYPRRRILVFLIVPLEVWLVVAILIGWDAAMYLSGDAASLGFLAHAGGALFGWLFYKLEPRVELALRRVERRGRRPELEHDEEIEARLDTLLEKISRDGMGALSKKERDFLKRASSHYKNKV